MFILVFSLFLEHISKIYSTYSPERLPLQTLDLPR